MRGSCEGHVAASETFRLTSDEITKRTSLEAIEARGTVRIALKAAGLDPASVDGGQMAVVLERVLPGELARRGVDDAEALCAALAAEVRTLAPQAVAVESPENVFRRLGGST